MLPIESEPASLCRCGLVWLMPWQTTFTAEGHDHGRRSCWVTR